LFETKSLFGQFTVKQSDLLSNIVKQSALYGILKNTDAVRQNCVRLWAAILPSSNSSSLPQQLLDGGKNIHDIDMFHLLVSLCLSMPNLYADKPKLQSVACGSLNCFNIFKLVLQAHCVQITLTKIKLGTFSTAKDVSATLDDTTAVSSHNHKLLDFFHFVVNTAVDKNVIRITSQERAKLMKLSGKSFASTLVNSLISFLRCSALFFANLTNTIPTDSISNNSGKKFKIFTTVVDI
jgi:hypothetical protein